MDRKKLLCLAYQRSGRLAINNPEYMDWVKKYTVDVLKQDVGKADITTTSIFGKKASRTAKAVIRVKDNGVVAGIEETVWFYKHCGIKAVQHKKDGDVVRPGDVILELSGPEQSMLETERIGLNVLQRMSGIATVTRRLQNKIKEAGYDMIVVATRKTHWQLLDKRAVCLGGGGTHRLGLWEAILIKDNHLEELKKVGYADDYIEEALGRAWGWRDKAVFVEIEVENADDALRAAKKFKQLQKGVGKKPCIIMLDNVPPSKISEIIARLKKYGLWENVLIEASGGINEDNIIEYARAGIDAASLGSITHSPKALNINQTMVE